VLHRRRPSHRFPPQCCAGGGVVVDLSATSRGFDYGYEAVRVRVKTNVLSPVQFKVYLGMLRSIQFLLLILIRVLRRSKKATVKSVF
jgi:hypothetical protein